MIFLDVLFIVFFVCLGSAIIGAVVCDYDFSRGMYSGIRITSTKDIRIGGKYRDKSIPKYVDVDLSTSDISDVDLTSDIDKMLSPPEWSEINIKRFDKKDLRFEGKVLADLGSSHSTLWKTKKGKYIIYVVIYGTPFIKIYSTDMDFRKNVEEDARRSNMNLIELYDLLGKSGEFADMSYERVD